MMAVSPSRTLLNSIGSDTWRGRSWWNSMRGWPSQLYPTPHSPIPATAYFQYSFLEHWPGWGRLAGWKRLWQNRPASPRTSRRGSTTPGDKTPRYPFAYLDPKYDNDNEKGDHQNGEGQGFVVHSQEEPREVSTWNIDLIRSFFNLRPKIIWKCIKTISREYHLPTNKFRKGLYLECFIKITLISLCLESLD